MATKHLPAFFKKINKIYFIIIQKNENAYNDFFNNINNDYWNGIHVIFSYLNII